MKLSMRIWLPPSFAKNCLALSEATKSVMLLAIDPSSAPPMTKPTAQPSSVPPCNRTARSQTPSS